MIASIVLVSAVFASEARVDRDMCGFNSLFVLAVYLNPNEEDVDRRLEALLPPGQAPYSLNDLRLAAAQLGFRTRVARWSDKRAAWLDSPAILHVRSQSTSNRPDHFVACFGERNGRVCVADFPYPPSLMSREDVIGNWDGDVLYLGPADRPVHFGHHIDRRSTTLLSWMIAGVLLVAAALWNLDKRCVPLFRHLFRPVKQFVFGILLLAIGLLILFQYRSGGRKEPALRATEPLIRIHASDELEQTINFELENASRQDLTITGVTSSCTCLVPLWEGKHLSAGEACIFPVTVKVPRFGRGGNRLLVHHDGVGSPCELRVGIEGGQPPPFVLAVVNKQPTFGELDSLDETEVVTVETIEEHGAHPWLLDVRASHDDVQATLAAVKEYPLAGVVKREYLFNIGWKRLPESLELQSRLYVETRYGSQDRISIGKLIARRNTKSFQPPRIRLSAQQPSQTVLFQPGDVWRISASAVDIPKWINTSWKTIEGRQELIVSLRSHAEVIPVEDLLIPLETLDGRIEYLAVAAE